MERTAVKQLAEAGITLGVDREVAYFKLDKSHWDDPEFNYWAWTQEMLDNFGHLAHVYRRVMDELVSTGDYVGRDVHVNETEKVIFDDGYAIFIYKSTAREGILKIYYTNERPEEKLAHDTEVYLRMVEAGKKNEAMLDRLMDAYNISSEDTPDLDHEIKRIYNQSKQVA